MSMSDQERRLEVGRLILDYREKLQEIACLDSKKQRTVHSLTNTATVLASGNFDVLPADALDTNSQVAEIIDAVNRAQAERAMLEESLRQHGLHQFIIRGSSSEAQG